MKNIIIVTCKSWNIKNANNFKKKYRNDFNTFIIENNKCLTYEKITKINPDYIFFPHWSWIIPKEIYLNYNCIVFHMTDLPFGRGGSPLQNLIEKNIDNTKISALKVEKEIDSGKIYLKENLNLNGSAEEIFIRASKIIFENMIPKILQNNIIPKEQEGEITKFTRRTPEQSEIKDDFNLEKIYNYIRMLDAEGYPKAFIKFGDKILKLSRASMKSEKIIADVEIMEETNE
jgi:methionyl-tRNA formyltransferase